MRKGFTCKGSIEIRIRILTLARSTLVSLYRSNGDATHWPEFIECFYTRIHCESSFDDNIRMTYLLSRFDSEAEKAIEAVETCVLFYASALKTLKKEFWNTLLVAHLHLKSVFNEPQIKSNNRSTLWEFHQDIKVNIKWLSSARHKTTF